VSPERSAARLLRWYPAAWRARYGPEFADLLEAELAERPRDWRRTANVVAGGLRTRLSGIGLTAHALDPSRQAQAGLGTAGAASAAFLLMGVALQGQLAIGWQWATPRAPAITAGLVIMTACAAAAGLLAVAWAGPAAWCAVAGLIRRPTRRLAAPAGLALAGAVALAAGAHHFQNAWPGTGGTAGHGRLVPGGLAAFSWASTLSVSSYWTHPAALARFPGAELAWMVLSPVALAALIAGAAGVLRRAAMPPRLVAVQARLAAGLTVALGGFLVGAACWVLGSASAGPGLFHAGALDLTAVAAMTVTLAVAGRAATTARRAATA
jgi:hypothetical protein